jgi:hypothetical protein
MSVQKNGGSLSQSVDVVVQMRAIASSMPPTSCPRQSRRGPAPRFCPVSEVIDFALVRLYGLNSNYVSPRQATPRICAAGARRSKHASAVARLPRSYGRMADHLRAASLLPFKCAPSLQACRQPSAPGWAAEGPRRGFVPQAKSLTSCL